MAKRFIETNIWDKKSIRILSPKLKLAWFYLVTKCNHAGIWECDIDLMNFQTGENYSIDELLTIFEGNLISLGDDKYYLAKFIEYQYGLPLNPNVKVHQSVIKLLEKYHISTDVKTKIHKAPLDERKERFAKIVLEETSDKNIDSKILQDFISYWAESSTFGNKMRYEKQPVFDINRRIATWIKNKKNWANDNKDDLIKSEEHIEKEYQKQQQRLKNAEKDIASDEERKKALGLN